MSRPKRHQGAQNEGWPDLPAEADEQKDEEQSRCRIYLTFENQNLNVRVYVQRK